MLYSLLIPAMESAHHGFGLHSKILLGCTVGVVLSLMVFAFLATGQFGIIPKGWGAVFEHIFDWLDDIAQSFMGPEGRKYVPLAMSFFLFILFSNWSGLLPWPVVNVQDTNVVGHVETEQAQGVSVIPITWEAPSANYNTTLALALLSFLAFNLFGLAKRVFPPAAPAGGHDHSHDHGHDHEHSHDHAHGDEDFHPHANPGGIVGLWIWISHFWAPTPKLWATLTGLTRYLLVPALFFLFLGLNIIEEVARILSLSLRLYGNISGEHEAKMNLFYTMREFLNQGGIGGFILAGVLWASLVFVTCLGALAGFIQAMVFTMLTLSYIAHAVADDH